MAKGPEARIKRIVKEHLERAGAWFFMPFMAGAGHAGVPDFVGIHRGRGFGIECKAGKRKPTALQERELQRITAAEGTAIVVNETEGWAALHAFLTFGDG